MYFELSKHNEEYNSYKYICDDKTYSVKYLNNFFNILQSKIPICIHPNIITISSLIIMSFAYIITKIFPGIIGNIIFSFSMICYLIFDSIYGIHARKTNQTSIIGEYFNHIGDVIIFGYIIDEVLNSVIDNLIIKKNLTLLSSLYFIKTHFFSIKSKKITFEPIDDVIVAISSSSIVNMFKFNLQNITDIILENFYLDKFILRNICNLIIFSLLPLYYYVNVLINILKNKTNEDYFSLNKTDALNSYIFSIYYFLKLLIVYYGNINSFLSVNLIDTYMMFCLINSKIFQVPIDYKIIVLILLYYFNPFIISIIASIYTYYLIFNIGNSLKTKFY